MNKLILLLFVSFSLVHCTTDESSNMITKEFTSSVEYQQLVDAKYSEIQELLSEGKEMMESSELDPSDMISYRDEHAKFIIKKRELNLTAANDAIAIKKLEDGFYSPGALKVRDYIVDNDMTHNLQDSKFYMASKDFYTAFPHVSRIELLKELLPEIRLKMLSS